MSARALRLFLSANFYTQFIEILREPLSMNSIAKTTKLRSSSNILYLTDLKVNICERRKCYVSLKPNRSSQKKIQVLRGVNYESSECILFNLPRCFIHRNHFIFIGCHCSDCVWYTALYGCFGFYGAHHTYRSVSVC